MEKNDSAFNTGKKRSETSKFMRAVVFFLLVAGLIVFIWAKIKMKTMQKTTQKEMATMEDNFANEKKQLTNVYDSLAVTEMELTARVFSWAIRSAMITENLEQVNEYFANFIKEPGVSKVQLIDAPSARVLISTNKKDEGKAIADSSILETEATHHIIHEDSTITIVSPVMGLNSKIGILVIEEKKK